MHTGQQGEGVHLQGERGRQSGGLSGALARGAVAPAVAAAAAHAARAAALRPPVPAAPWESALLPAQAILSVSAHNPLHDSSHIVKRQADA